MMGPKRDPVLQEKKDKQRSKFYYKILFNDYLTTITNTDLPGIP